MKLENERLHVGYANGQGEGEGKGEETAHCESSYAEKALRIDQVEEKDESVLRPGGSSDIKSRGPKQKTSKDGGEETLLLNAIIPITILCFLSLFDMNSGRPRELISHRSEKSPHYRARVSTCPCDRHSNDSALVDPDIVLAIQEKLRV